MMDMGDMPGMDMDAATSSPPTQAATATTATLSLAVSQTVAAVAAIGHDEPSSATAAAGMDEMGSMSSSFHVGTGDALWIPSLTPTTGAGYVGAIILLMFLAASLRFVVTLEHLYDKRWKGKRAVVEVEEAGSSFKEDPSRVARKFNVSVLFPRVLFLVVTMTLGYLLMLAVMTFNLGYLLAVLGGGVLGEIAFSWFKD